MKKELVIKEVIISVIAFCGSFFISRWIVDNHRNWSITVMTLTLGIFLTLLFFFASDEAIGHIGKSKVWRSFCNFLISKVEKIKDSVASFVGTLLTLMPFIIFGISLMLKRGLFWKKE